MDYLEKLAIPQGQPGYVSKSTIAKVLEEEFNISYSNTKFKKMKRAELIAEYKH